MVGAQPSITIIRKITISFRPLQIVHVDDQRELFLDLCWMITISSSHIRVVGINITCKLIVYSHGRYFISYKTSWALLWLSFSKIVIWRYTPEMDIFWWEEMVEDEETKLIFRATTQFHFFCGFYSNLCGVSIVREYQWFTNYRQDTTYTHWYIDGYKRRQQYKLTCKTGIRQLFTICGTS